MKFVTIEEREIVLRLAPEEAARMAELIYKAAAVDDEDDTADIAEAKTAFGTAYAAALEAAALAAGMRSFVSEKVSRQVTLGSMRTGGMWGSVWGHRVPEA